MGGRWEDTPTLRSSLINSSLTADTTVDIVSVQEGEIYISTGETCLSREYISLEYLSGALRDSTWLWRVRLSPSHRPLPPAEPWQATNWHFSPPTGNSRPPTGTFGSPRPSPQATNWQLPPVFRPEYAHYLGHPPGVLGLPPGGLGVPPGVLGHTSIKRSV